MLTTPNFRGQDCASEYTTGMLAMRTCRSGGINVLLADGSVKFIKDNPILLSCPVGPKEITERVTYR